MEELNSPKYDSNGTPAFGFSLRDMLSVVFRRRRVIVLSFVGLLAGALLAICLLPPTYEAQMKILVERERIDPVVSTEANIIEQDRGLTPDEVTSEVELFQSRDSLEKAVVDCGLYESKGGWSPSAIKSRVLKALGLAPDRDTRIFQAVIKLEKDLQVIPINDSSFIKVTYDSPSPQLAAQVLKDLGNLYLVKHSAVHRPPGTTDFFQQQAEQYKKQLTEATNNLVSFNLGTGVVSADFEKQVTLQKLSEFDVTLEQTRAAIAETKQRIDALQDQENSLPPRITTQVRTADNPQLMAQLKSTLLTLELKRTELLEKYDPSYRLVQEVGTEISQTLDAIADADQRGVREETTDRDPTHEWLRTEMAKARADLVGLEARASVMSGAVRTLHDKALRLDRASVVQQDLLRVAKADEESYLLYHRKREEASIADALDQKRIVNATVAEAAAVPLVPAGLPAGVKLVLASLVATLLSLGLAFLSEYFDPSFRTPGEVQDYLDMPVLASIPKNGH
jgi:uncharacterized protein involved in exopolysaccharide biosynthesis